MNALGGDLSEGKFKEWPELLSKPSWLGVAVLSILGVLYVVRLIADFVKTTILPKAYEQKLKRRELFLPLADKVLDASWNTAEYFRDGDPKLTDFKSGYVFVRPELATIRNAFHTVRYVYVQGPPSGGKTVVALNVAYGYSAAKHMALYFDRPSLITDQFLEFLQTSGGIRLLDRKSTILIVDDAHLEVFRVSHLFDLVHTNDASLQLLFVSRPLQKNELEVENTNYYDFTRYTTIIKIRSDAITEPLANFFSMKRFGHKMPPTILKSFLEECGNDLLLLGRYLRKWNGSSITSLPDIRKKVTQAVLVDLEKLRSLAPDAITALLIVSIFYRYEVQVEKAFLEMHMKLISRPLCRAANSKSRTASFSCVTRPWQSSTQTFVAPYECQSMRL